jgi:hypothetical protein
VRRALPARPNTDGAFYARRGQALLNSACLCEPVVGTTLALIGQRARQPHIRQLSYNQNINADSWFSRLRLACFEDN